MHMSKSLQRRCCSTIACSMPMSWQVYWSAYRRSWKVVSRNVQNSFELIYVILFIFPPNLNLIILWSFMQHRDFLKFTMHFGDPRGQKPAAWSAALCSRQLQGVDRGFFQCEIHCTWGIYVDFDLFGTWGIYGRLYFFFFCGGGPWTNPDFSIFFLKADWWLG